MARRATARRKALSALPAVQLRIQLRIAAHLGDPPARCMEAIEVAAVVKAIEELGIASAR
jgi:hypothetical protein